MKNVTSLEAASGAQAQVPSYDPLEEIMSFYEQADEKHHEQDQSLTRETDKLGGAIKVNFLEECQKLMDSIEKAQKRSKFYLNEILSHLDQD